MKNCIRPHYEKLKPLKSGFMDNSNFENNRDPWKGEMVVKGIINEVMSSIDNEVSKKKVNGEKGKRKGEKRFRT